MRPALVAILLTGIAVLFGGLAYFKMPASVFVAAGLAVAFVALAGLTAISKGRAQNLFLLLASLTLCVLVIQATAALVLKRKGTGEAAVQNDGLIAANEVFGWGPRHPGVFHIVKTDADGTVVFDVHATIDDAYHRKTTSANGAPAVGFFGDSFIFGDGLNDDETLPQAFATLNAGKIPVVNFGFSGWAPSQNLANLLDEPYRSKLPNLRRIILFTATFHVERTACKGQFAVGSGPRYVIDGSTVGYDGPCRGRLPGFLSSLASTVRRMLGGAQANKPTAADVETYIKIIETFAETARRAHHVETTVLFEPYGDELIAGTGFTQQKIVDRLRAGGIDVLVKTVSDDPRYQIPRDGHPTGLANLATARQIESHLKRVAPHTFDAGSP